MPAASAHRLTVRAGDTRVAIAAGNVAEVIRSPRISRVPNGPAGLLGVMHLRGTVLPVVSLRGLLGAQDVPAGAERVVVLRRDPPVGLAVDAVEALRAVGHDGAGPGDGRLLLDQEDGARWLDLDAALRERFGGLRAPARAMPSRPEAGAAAVAKELAFLAFTLAGQDYALPLGAVAEVVNLPAVLTTLPRTEEVLLGVFPLRGAVLPALSLRALLGLPGRALAGTERVVVARIGRHRLALVVDRVDVILRAPRDRVGPAPDLFNRGAGEARIDAVLRLADGRGLVSILSPERVLADDRVARLLADTDQDKDETMASLSPAAGRERFLVIRLGGESYGLPIVAVDEVVRLPEALARLPKAPAYVRGVMSLRGRVIPVIDQRQRFAVAGEEAAGGRVVIVTLGPLQAGFAVDGAAEILEVEAADLLPAPDMSDGGGRIFDRAARVARSGEVVLLIDPAALLNRAEADLLRDLTAHSRAS
ncbi:chemotaxis protein CheW [Roseococcus sp. SYP-B2431]|uniref:chemotaxis protein CheW n=1 Tax=Roseococcus sp. SYP-B2431 TaxID=2496640 RepID=UPI00103E4043|nr:chemotaxis protein CheW [Roseococcus sp. SYP-B2431]TCH96099.1 chemotaxis protein CheW [Roseococcus sp. SYP-B2431]